MATPTTQSSTPPSINAAPNASLYPSIQSFPRSPKEHVVTGLSITMAPLLASSSRPSTRNPSSTSSPRLYVSSSMRNSPFGLQALSNPPDTLAPFLLPESLVDVPSPAARTMVDVAGRPARLIRRISRGAQNKLRGRRSSASSLNRRESSSGPVIMRRRSNSRNAGNGAVDASDAEVDHDDEDDLTGDAASASGVESPGDALGAHGRARARSIDGTLSPTVPSLLQRGTPLTKVTKRKRKDLTFWLDVESARICWSTTKPSKSIYIDDIQSIRKGSSASNYREELQISAQYEPRWFTIVYATQERSKGRAIKLAHLIAPDDVFFELWTRWLEAISKSRVSLMAGIAKTGEKSMEALWNREMAKRGSPLEGMDLACARELCRSLQINCTDNAIQAQFDKADEDRNGYLNFTQFKIFVRQLKERQDVKIIFRRAVRGRANEARNGTSSASEQELDLDHFLTFLREIQGVDVDVDRLTWTSTFEKYARRPKPSHIESDAISQTLDIHGKDSTGTARTQGSTTTMTLQGFQRFLSSSFNSVLVPRTPKVTLDKPLNEYFISSSHNTYLLGRQFAGESSTEAYITALEKGCRCIEIDCWDGPNGQPAVTHGRTLTKDVLFVDCIETIDRYAFAASQYPLIISLEVHCNAEQQETMATIMKRTFKDKLVLEPMAPSSYVLPSPEELRGKILIKVKAAHTIEDAAMLLEQLSFKYGQRGLSSPYTHPVVPDDVVTDSPIVSSPTSTSPSEVSISFWGATRTPSGAEGSPASSGEDSDDPWMDRKRKRKTSNIVKPLSDLGVYTRGYKFSDFRAPESKSYNHVFSLAEGTFNDLCKKDPQSKYALERHNIHHLMRVYPGMKRVNSDNFDPLTFWRRGVQMAALNWQTYDIGTQINDAMFAAGSDRTGYVLKPEELRMTHRPKKEQKLVRFSVDIISAQQLPRPRGLAQETWLNPYVEFEMYSAEDKARGIATGQGGSDASARNGMSGIGCPLRKRTRIVERNGYDPLFEESVTMTLETKYPSLVFVRWVVRSSSDGRSTKESDGVLATFTAKLSSLQQGYRHLPLFNVNGEQYLFSTLFCRIKKEDHIAVASCGNGSSAQVTSPTTGGRGEFFKRFLVRTPSERKRAASSNAAGGTDKENTGYFSRTSSIERQPS